MFCMGFGLVNATYSIQLSGGLLRTRRDLVHDTHFLLL